MKIRTKLTLIPAIFLMLMVLIITAIVAFSVYRNTQTELRHYRENEMTRVKNELRDKVNMVYELIASEYQNATDKVTIEERYGHRVKNVVEVAVATLRSYSALVDNGEMTLEQAQTEAKQKIASMRYDGSTGYLWINDTSRPFAKMIMHPTLPNLDETFLNDNKWNTALGSKKNLFNAAVDLTAKQTSGFIDYEWPKPTADGGLTEMQPKVSYVSLFKPWGWIVGSGIYVDDAERNSIESIEHLVSLLRYDDGEGYFFILTDSLPYPSMVMHPISPQLNDTLMNNSKWNSLANNGTEHLFTAIIKATKNRKKAGFVDYVWNKPTKNGLTEPLPKLSYARAFSPLNWAIVSGVYTDKIDKYIAAKEATANKEIRILILKIVIIALLILLLSFLLSYFFAASISKSLEELTQRARDISLGKNLAKPIDSTNRKDEIGQLARAIERLQTSVNMMMQRMKRK